MRKTIASLATLLALAVAPSAQAAFGDGYGALPINGAPGAADEVPALAGQTHAFWAGGCDRSATSAQIGFGDLGPLGGFGERRTTVLAAQNTVPGLAPTTTPSQVSVPAPASPDHCLDYGAVTAYDVREGQEGRLWQTFPYDTGDPHVGGGTIGQELGPDCTFAATPPLPDHCSWAPSWRLPPEDRAGAHPDGSTLLGWSRFKESGPGGEFYGTPDGNVDNIIVELPPGFVANPQAVPQCTNEQFGKKPLRCPSATQVGILRLNLEGLGVGVPQNQSGNWDTTYPVYNLEPREGKPAELGFGYGGAWASIRLEGKVRTNGDFGVTAFVGQIPAALVPISQEITIWGVPWAVENDIWRTKFPAFTDDAPTECLKQPGLIPAATVDYIPPGGMPLAHCRAPYEPDWGEIKPFFTNETDCNPGPDVTLHTDGYQHPGAFVPDGSGDAAGLPGGVGAPNGDPDPSDPDWKTYSSAQAAVVGCEDLDFSPEITLDPTGPGGAAVQAADSPTGLDVELEIPQNDDLPFAKPADGAPQAEVDDYVEAAGEYWRSDAGRATAHLKDTVVTLPEDMTLNPAAADGQAACSMAEIGVTSTSSPVPPRIRFDNSPVACPESSKVGEVVVETALLEEADWPQGSVYLAKQGQNPFGSDFAIYIAIESPARGLIVKLAGKVTPDPQTGRLTTTFLENPELPFDAFRLKFKGGPRAALATPATCGTHISVNQFTSHAQPSSPVAVNAPLHVTSSPAGGCPGTPGEQPLKLGFSAGSTEILGGSYSPFSARFTRGDGNQELDRIELTTPEGFAAKLAGVPYCSEASIAQAIGRTATGDGALEKGSPSCPDAAKVGTTTIGAGAGSHPYFVKGNVYLAGPYKGAPVSLAFIVPAVAGPFDLGVQVVRTALQVHPKTAQVTAVSDTIPKILRGVPLRLRDVRVDIDRKDFTLNPTDCSETAVSGKVYGASGAVTNVSNRFQVAECARLGFKPSLTLRLKGGTKRTKYQGLVATLTARPGDANIARTSVTMPRSAFLAQEHIRTVCTRVQFAADACPAGSIYGKATAWSPLLDEPLSGNVYLRSSDNKLPDLVTDLRGPASQPIRVELSGRTDSFKRALRNTFDVVPDAPVTKFELELFGGSKGLIVNSQDLCRKKHFATVKMTAQNGREHNFRPVVKNGCKKIVKPKKGKQGKKGSAKQRPVAATRSLAKIARGLF